MKTINTKKQRRRARLKLAWKELQEAEVTSRPLKGPSIKSMREQFAVEFSRARASLVEANEAVDEANRSLKEVEHGHFGSDDLRQQAKRDVETRLTAARERRSRARHTVKVAERAAERVGAA